MFTLYNIKHKRFTFMFTLYNLIHEPFNLYLQAHPLPLYLKSILWKSEHWALFSHWRVW